MVKVTSTHLRALKKNISLLRVSQIAITLSHARE
jgi:hypothetical protein